MISGESIPATALRELISLPVFSLCSSMEESIGENSIRRETFFSSMSSTARTASNWLMLRLMAPI